MKKIQFTLKTFAFLAFTLACATAAQAQATRTWVSGVGDDVNPCSRTAPCKTFAGAISKTAAGGEIDALDPGGFGTITITKNIIIDGTTGAGFGSILASGTNGVNINDSATASPNTIVVILRNLSINGAGTTLGINAINLTSGRRLTVENCQIQNFSGAGINVNQTGAANNTGTFVTVTNTTINNTNRGIDLLNSVQFVTAIVNKTLITNQVDGVRLRTNAHITLNDSAVVFGSTSGITLFGAAGTGAGTSANIINTVVNSNGTGLINNSGASNLGGATFEDNGTAISMTVNQAVKTYGTNNITGTITGGSLGLTPAQ
jgi:hypothetical protein